MFKAACFWSKAAFLRYNTALLGADNLKTFLISWCHVVQHAFFSVHIPEKKQKTVPPSIQASIIPLCGTKKTGHYLTLPLNLLCLVLAPLKHTLSRFN